MNEKFVYYEPVDTDTGLNHDRGATSVLLANPQENHLEEVPLQSAAASPQNRPEAIPQLPEVTPRLLSPEAAVRYVINTQFKNDATSYDIPLGDLINTGLIAAYQAELRIQALQASGDWYSIADEEGEARAERSYLFESIKYALSAFIQSEYRRHAQRSMPLGERFTAAPGVTDVETHVLNQISKNEAMPKAEEVVDRLTDREHTVFMGLLEGMSHQEIAQQLGIEATTSSDYLRNAVTKIREVLGIEKTLPIEFFKRRGLAQTAAQQEQTQRAKELGLSKKQLRQKEYQRQYYLNRQQAIQERMREYQRKKRSLKRPVDKDEK